MLEASVCLITYNHARTIRDAMDSILEQRTACPFEVVAADTWAMMRRHLREPSPAWRLSISKVSTSRDACCRICLC